MSQTLSLGASIKCDMEGWRTTDSFLLLGSACTTGSNLFAGPLLGRHGKLCEVCRSHLSVFQVPGVPQACRGGGAGA